MQVEGLATVIDKGADAIFFDFPTVMMVMMVVVMIMVIVVIIIVILVITSSPRWLIKMF